MNNILFDSHIHFQEERLLKQTNVDYFACCGINPKDWADVQKLSYHNKNIIPFYGLHPWCINETNGNWRDVLENIISENKCGVGETGLDGVKGNLEDQTDAFIFHLGLANEYHRPVVIHMVKAYEKTFKILKDNLPQYGLMLHAYSGSKEMIKEFVKLGAYFSLGNFFIKKPFNKKLDILQEIPRDRLLVETDSPNKDEITLKDVLCDISKTMDIEFEELAKITTDNAKVFFKELM